LTLWCPCGVALPNVFRILKIFPREEVAHHLILQIDNTCLTGFPTLAYAVLSKKNKNPKKKFCLFPTPFLFPSVPLFSYLFHPSHLPSVFIQYFSPLFLSFSFRYIHSTCAQLSLSLLLAHSAPSFLSFRPIPVFSLLVFTSKSRHHFSFFCTVSPQVLRNFLCYTPYLILSLLSCLSVSLSLSSSSTFIHLAFASVFPLFHWHTLSFLSFSVFFFSFSLQHSVSVLHSSLPSTLSSNFATLFPAFTLSLFLLHLTM
jgi:hypothetical protein